MEVVGRKLVVGSVGSSRKLVSSWKLEEVGRKVVRVGNCKTLPALILSLFGCN